MKRAWLWATVLLVVAAAGAAAFSVLLLALWGLVSFFITMPICAAWGVGCAYAGYRLAKKHLRSGGT